MSDMSMIIVNDGQERWVADCQELLAALEAMGWERQGNVWIEPAQGDEAEPGEDPYTDLCARVGAYRTTHGDIDSLEARLPTLYFRPDARPNNRVWAWVSP